MHKTLRQINFDRDDLRTIEGSTVCGLIEGAEEDGGSEVEKIINKMTIKEILRQQLDLLAEASKNASDLELPALTNAMIAICIQLSEF